jgi:hypothetical protein
MMERVDMGNAVENSEHGLGKLSKQGEYESEWLLPKTTYSPCQDNADRNDSKVVKDKNGDKSRAQASVPEHEGVKKHKNLGVDWAPKDTLSRLKSASSSNLKSPGTSNMEGPTMERRVASDTYAFLPSTPGPSQSKSEQPKHIKVVKTGHKIRTTILREDPTTTVVDDVGSETISHIPMPLTAATDMSGTTLVASPTIPLDETPSFFQSKVPAFNDTPSQLIIMMEMLNQAQRHKELPLVRYSLNGAGKIVDDYERLLKLRDARGDPLLSSPRAYTRLRGELAAEIVHREINAAHGTPEAENLKGVLQEFCSATAAAAAKGAATTANAVATNGVLNQQALDHFAAEVLELIQQGVEASMQDSTGPLRLNVRQLDGQISRMDGQLDMVRSQTAAMGSALSAQNGLLHSQVEALNGALATTTAQIAAIGGNMAAQHTNFQAQFDAMHAITGRMNSLLDNQIASLGNNIQGEVKAGLEKSLEGAVDSAVRQHMISPGAQEYFKTLFDMMMQDALEKASFEGRWTPRGVEMRRDSSRGSLKFSSPPGSHPGSPQNLQ